jgi:hypothetical protein
VFALPTVPSDDIRAMAVRNILSVYDSADHETRARGAAWYGEANELAQELDSNVTRASGVIAALSANKSWRENCKLARAAYAGDHIGHVANARDKALAILAGRAPEQVLPMARKTGNFYLCIARPDHDSAVCIDRHAHDIALGKAMGEANRGLNNVNRYAWLAEAYREVGRLLGVPPMVPQATAWLVWRMRLGAGRGRTYDAQNGW